MHTSIGLCSEHLAYRTVRTEGFRRGIACTALPSSSGQSAQGDAKWHLNSRNEVQVRKAFKIQKRLTKLLKEAWYNARTAAQQGSDSLPTGPPGMLVLAMAAVVPPSPADLLSNKVFMAGFVAWFGAQFGKIFTERYKKGYWDLLAFTKPGGTPSSHSSLCAGVTTAVAMVEGLGSPLFAAALAFTAVVMYDAMGVRRHAGLHAQVLNKVVNEMRDSTESMEDLGPLKEVLGHTPRQVLCGGALGVVVGYFYPLYC
ncbi:hypothetical protein CEUSTIGMA_g8321.t1 [Chlamydomonas eustigma]|uniref:Uncharacterized protein n=1 Tax=Chlamydomonas eustigma TaxID=1157962 RepID=A0A250XCW8_9CHLO|nr:hypothetical protein CEUSTIGMA_g8321.t1 [Chlamydomonas eustigma]|eukprot:GAX80886.1 hypothetical protein CEUSTIGMA_g8321.t1 [Chlamydomonas eustigma]